MARREDNESSAQAEAIASVTVAGAARLMHCSLTTVRELVHSRKLRAWRTTEGGDLRIRIRDIDAYMDQQEIRSPVERIPKGIKLRAQ